MSAKVEQLVGGARQVQNWLQLLRFALVGASGYVVNLVVYSLSLYGLGLHYLLAATAAFLLAVTNNFMWNRHWTFRAGTHGMLPQALRFFAVSITSFVASLAVLHTLVAVGGIHTALAQPMAISTVLPFSFLGNRLWTFCGGAGDLPAGSSVGPVTWFDIGGASAPSPSER